MRNRLTSIRPRTPAGLALFAEAAVLLSAIRLALPLLRLRLVRRLLTHCAPGVPVCSASTILWAVNAAEKYSPLGSTCLGTAMLGQAMLRRQGYDSRLEIGVRRDANGEFRAHAWVTREGKIVIGGPPSVVQNYTVMPDLEGLIV